MRYIIPFANSFVLFLFGKYLFRVADFLTRGSALMQATSYIAMLIYALAVVHAINGVVTYSRENKK
jgi:hypothetical protein